MEMVNFTILCYLIPAEISKLFETLSVSCTTNKQGAALKCPTEVGFL